MFKKLKQKINEGVQTAVSKVNTSGLPPENGETSLEGALIDFDANSTALSLTGSSVNASNVTTSVNGSFIAQQSPFQDPMVASTPSEREHKSEQQPILPSLLDGSYVTAEDETADSSLLPDNSTFPQTPAYSVSSDTEGEIETESVVNLESFSKEELYQKFLSVEKASIKYKSRYVEVREAYVVAERERKKLHDTLSQSQDRALRRISELIEQSELERRSKQDLSLNFTATLEEKDQEINALRTQVKCLRDSASEQVGTPQGAANEEELNALREKVKRMDGLLAKCKDTIRANKEKQLLVTNERDALKGQLEETKQCLDQLKANSQSLMSEESEALRRSLSRKDEEMATLKESFSSQLDGMQAELSRVSEQWERVSSENEELKSKAQDQLEKSREIIKTLQEEKKEMKRLLEDQGKTIETMIASHKQETEKLRLEQEEEKSAFMMQVSKVKADTLNLVQRESEEGQVKVVAERDRWWQHRISELEDQHAMALASKVSELALNNERKDAELQQRLQEKEEETALALEEQQLQRQALQTHTESLKKELSGCLTELNRLQIQISEQQDTLHLYKSQSNNVPAFSAKIAEQERTIEHLEGKLSALKEVVDESHKEQQVLASQLSAAQEACELLTAQKLQSEGQVERLKVELSQRESDHEKLLKEKESECMTMMQEFTLEASRQNDDNQRQAMTRMREELELLRQDSIAQLEHQLREELASEKDLALEVLQNQERAAAKRQLDESEAMWKQRLSAELNEVAESHSAVLREQQSKFLEDQETLKRDLEKKRNDEIHQINEQHQTSIENLNALLSSSSSELSSTLRAQQQAELSSMISSHKIELDSLRESLTAELNKAYQQSESLQQQHFEELNQLRDTHQMELSAAAQTYERSIAEIQEQLERQQDLVQEFRGRLLILEKELEEERVKVNEREAKLNEDFEERLAVLQNSATEARSEYAIKLNDIHQDYADRLSAKELERQQDVERLEQEIVRHIEALDSTQSQTAKHLESQQRVLIEREVETLKSQEDLQNLLEDRHQTIIARDHMIESLRAELSEKDAALERNDQQIRELNTQTKQITDLKQDLVEKEEQLLGLRMETDSLHSELDRLRKDVLLKEIQNDAAMAEVASLKLDKEGIRQNLLLDHQQTVDEYQLKLADLMDRMEQATQLAQSFEERQNMQEEQHSSELEHTRRRAESLSSQLQEALASASQVHQDSLLAKEDLKQRVESLQELLLQKEDQLASTHKDIEESNAKYEQLKAQAQKRLLDMKRQRDEKAALLAASEQEQSETMTNLVLTHQQQIHNLMESHQKEKNAAEIEHVAQLQELSSRVENCTNKIQSHELEKLALIARINDSTAAEKELLVSNEKLLLQLEQLAKLQAEKEDLLKSIAYLDAENKSQNNALEDMKSQLAESNLIIAELKDRNASLHADADNLSVSKDELLREMRLNVENATELYKATLGKYESLTMEYDSLIVKHSKDSHLLADLQKEFVLVDQECKKQVIAIDEMRVSLSTITVQANEKDAQNASLVKENDDLRSNIQSLNSEIQAFQEREAELAGMVCDLQSAQSRIAALETTIESLTSKLVQMEPLEAEVKALRVTNISLSETIANQKMAVNDSLLEVNALKSIGIATSQHSPEDSNHIPLENQRLKDELIEQLNAQHRTEVSHLMAEFEQKMKDREVEFERIFTEAYAKSQSEEDRKQLYHQSIVDQLHSQIAEKDSQLQNVSSLYEEIQALAEHLKQRENELLAQIELLQESVSFNKSGSESPPGSPASNRHVTQHSTPKAKKRVTFANDLHSDSSKEASLTAPLTEPTELEYLRNILYEYMMGNQTQTLAKVIATVMKFSQDQTRKVLQKEELK